MVNYRHENNTNTGSCNFSLVHWQPWKKSLHAVLSVLRLLLEKLMGIACNFSLELRDVSEIHNACKSCQDHNYFLFICSFPKEKSPTKYPLESKLSVLISLFCWDDSAFRKQQIAFYVRKAFSSASKIWKILLLENNLFSYLTLKRPSRLSNNYAVFYVTFTDVFCSQQYIVTCSDYWLLMLRTYGKIVFDQLRFSQLIHDVLFPSSIFLHPFTV